MSNIDAGGREVKQMWDSLKEQVEELDLDAVKNAGGTASAGVRFRKGLRDLKRHAGAIVKATVELDKQRRLLAKEEKTESKSKGKGKVKSEENDEVEEEETEAKEGKRKKAS